MRINKLLTLWLFQSVFFVSTSTAQSTSDLEELTGNVEQITASFIQHYQQQLGMPQACIERQNNLVNVCSGSLRNDGNGPYIMHHNAPTEWVIVLFHGLSDSPYYLRSIAKDLHDAGMTVVVGLLPGHGLKQADQDMQDPGLSDRWKSEVETITAMTRPLGQKMMVGGFSTGGTLATHYALRHSDDVSGLILLSGALALSDSAERMSRVWGMQFITKLVDGDYQTFNPNPYKYPGVALFAVIELMEVIRQVRELVAVQPLTIPIFAAHSLSDVSTPYAGVESLVESSEAPHSLFLIDEKYELCHGDLPLNEQQVKDMAVVMPEDEFVEICTIPEANPLHGQMMIMMKNFIQQK